MRDSGQMCLIISRHVDGWRYSHPLGPGFDGLKPLDRGMDKEPLDLTSERSRFARVCDSHDGGTGRNSAHGQRKALELLSAWQRTPCFCEPLSSRAKARYYNVQVNMAPAQNHSVENGAPISLDHEYDSSLSLGPIKSDASYLVDEHPIWGSSKWTGKVEMKKQIFCNRSLNMKSIVAVGFDMDYTLAQYKPETFEVLAYQGTVQKLVYNLGYPTDLLQWTFDWKYMIRGLVLDKRRGNILKMDRHKYVKVAYHGFQELSREERMATYGNTLSREPYDEPDYALIDTLFSLAEAYLFAQLVEFKDAYPNKLPSTKAFYSEDDAALPRYAQVYKDVRAAVDLCHRDGTLKQAVSLDPGRYIHEDPLLVPMFKMLRDSGRMTFLVTNSLWDYTHVVMNYLCGKTGNEGIPRDDEWLNYFDLVITGSAKPVFFADANRAPLFEVDIKTGMLQNTDNGTPLMQVGGLGLNLEAQKTKSKQHCRAFQGGGVAHLHKLLAIEAGAQVLYVGDHIYGDILRSKKQLGWRTMLVIPELENEIGTLQQNLHLQSEFRKFMQEREDVEDLLQRSKWNLRLESNGDEERQEFAEKVKLLQTERDKVRDLQRQTHKELHQKFHEIWGQLMKTGYQNSRFAHQVERFACLYTSQVTNLCYYSPDKSYRTTEDFMPHEMAFINL